MVNSNFLVTDATISENRDFHALGEIGYWRSNGILASISNPTSPMDMSSKRVS
ncbi:uncharacterized protein FOMMEDRAFT_162565 [Fomitiporia mediterranea MF3/22]|uniref:Uncharacterized protein n=1 Tax=Fomitiporia mediterranea (strain MF3/22) TaxID=694068 RepID=R7SJK4_FOMME|nr:uncharacterized protein FOMMEDRAFT_162565 [Fomitiporia mediterranea MF3/22]EJC97754.1 hypothetical protein FOMMEDRAFT_162565 [Fomitiporia mediterranea MF3/22]